MDRFTPPIVLPSLMSADMIALGAQLDALLDAGARVFHVDVMDGHFVPNLTLGTGFAAAVADAIRGRGGILDVHLMVDDPGRMIDLFAPHAGAVSVHVEADPHSHRHLAHIRDHGCLAGLALNPGTPAEAVTPLVDLVDYVNVMSVNPGFAGQSFIPSTPERVGRLRKLLPDRVVIEVDGGIGPGNIGSVRAAGAGAFVSASSIFGADDPVAAYVELDQLAR